jgi:hypothetical protein
MELLEEMQGAGQTSDWLAVERIYERLAEYCGQRNG